MGHVAASPHGTRHDGDVRVHVDTDLGEDPDDAAALAMLLGWPGVEVVGITTVGDPDGRRAGCARRLLDLAGVADVEVRPGAAHALDGAELGRLGELAPLWGGPVPPVPSDPDAALESLRTAVRTGATILAIGAWTDLALVEERWPGTLAEARVVAMGGWTGPLGPGLPAWDAGRDTNVRRDVDAARVVLDRAGELTLVTLRATLQALLRRDHLPVLEASGPIGRLLAQQAVAFSEQRGWPALAHEHDGWPDDLVLPLHDPLAAAVGLGWSGAPVARRRLRPVAAGASLRLDEAPDGREIGVVERVDGDAFVAIWLDAVAHADALAGA